MSESYSGSVLQTPVLVAEMRTGTQAAPKYVDGNLLPQIVFPFFSGRWAQTFISVIALAALFTYILLRTNSHKVLHMGLDLEITGKHD